MKNYTPKISLFSLVVMLLFCSKVFSQKYLYVRDDGKTTTISQKLPNGSFVDLDAAQLKKVAVIRGLVINASLVDKFVLKISSVASDGKTNDITKDKKTITPTNGNRYTYITKDTSIKSLKIEVTPTGRKAVNFDVGEYPVAQTETPEQDAASQAADAQANTTQTEVTYKNWREYVAKNNGGNFDIIKGGKRYYPNSDKAYICIDPKGNIIGRKPVNLDQDDEVIFLVIIDKDDYDAYSIDDNDAEYAPTDLAFRPTDAVTDGAKINGGREPSEQYIVKEFIKGPYTNSNVVFNVKNDNTTLSTFTIHINPLYHVALGVSYVSSNLESPSFEVVPLIGSPGVNTIQSTNNSNRTFITFNVIWYWWSTLRYIQGDPLTRGRDVLKEPNLITRINPTFGVSLKGTLQENFFAGLTFEFARGGSICAGWHYGKVSQLSDRNFQLGTTVFDGAQSDLKTEDVWKWGQFIGITLDTRIFNRLFNRSTTGN